MKKYFIIIILLLICLSVIYPKNPLKNKYHIQIIYNESDITTIPLPNLEKRPVLLTNDTQNPEIINNGIYCSTDGKYIEALCRFIDKDEGIWEIKFAIEPLAKKGYSVLSIIVINKSNVLQQNDFVFKGNALSYMNMGMSPFNVIGLHTNKNTWFSITLNIE
jgi:hypothetical protein